MMYTKSQQIGKRTKPRQKDRTRIKAKDYQRAAEEHGKYCYFCGKTAGLELDHVQPRSRQGKGTWRNLRFLCIEHHRGTKSVHTSREMRNKLIELHTEMYGVYFWADAYDLYKNGLIDDPTDKAFEQFFEG